jgi:hypothetical protein
MAQFADLMTDILQGRQCATSRRSEPIFHIVFDLNEMPQIPALPFASPGASTFERNGGHKFPMGSDESPHLRGWFDDDGRLMVVATHNTDLGDGSSAKPSANGISKPSRRRPTCWA